MHKIVATGIDRKDGGWKFFVGPEGDPDFFVEFFFAPVLDYCEGCPGTLIAHDLGGRYDEGSLDSAISRSISLYRKSEKLDERFENLIREEVSDAIKFRGVEKAIIKYAEELISGGTVFDSETAFQTGAETAMKMLKKVGLDPYDEDAVADLAQTFFRSLGNSGRFDPNPNWFGRIRSYYTPLTY